MSSAELLADLWKLLHPETVKRWVKREDAHVADQVQTIAIAAEAWLEAYRAGVR